MLTWPSCSASVSSSTGVCPGCGTSLAALLHDAPTVVHGGGAASGSPSPGASTPARGLFSERFAPGTLASWLVLLVRFGLLAFIAAYYIHLAAEFPMTMDFSTWYAAGSIFALTLAAALLACGFYFSIGGKGALSLPDLGP